MLASSSYKLERSFKAASTCFERRVTSFAISDFIFCPSLISVDSDFYLDRIFVVLIIKLLNALLQES